MKFSIAGLIRICLLLLLCSCQSGNKVNFVPGTYSVSPVGYEGPIEMDVIFGNDSIQAIEVKSENETPGVGHKAIQPMIERIINANGVGVDAVTGATATSDAIKRGVLDAATQAGVSDISVFSRNK